MDTSPMRVWAFLLLAMLWTQGARAQAGVALGEFRGPRAGQLRTAVREAISGDRRFALVKRPHDVVAVVNGTVRRRGRGYELALRIDDGRTGDSLAERSVRVQRTIRSRTLMAWLLETLPTSEKSEPPATKLPESAPVAPEWETGPAAEAEPEPASPESSERPPSEPEHSTLELRPGVQLWTRSYAYEHGTSALRNQRFGPTARLALAARCYPLAYFTTGFVTNLGLDVHAQWMLPVAIAWGSSRYEAHSLALGAALRLRLPIAAHELGVLLGYGIHDLTVDRSQYGERPRVPSSSYGFVRAGVDARFALSTTWGVEARAAYLRLTSYGELTQRAWFPHASGGDGVEAELSASYAPSTTLALNAGLGLVRYGIALHPAVSDPGVVVEQRVASTFVDLSTYAQLGVSLRF